MFAERAQEAAKKAYDEALALYAEASSINLPGYDIPMLLKNAENIQKEVST